MRAPDKPLAWLHGEVKTPPFSQAARTRAGYLLRSLQRGDVLTMPDSRPMPEIGAACHELRVPDGRVDWRILYAIRPDAVVILGVEKKSTQRTPKAVLAVCGRRLRAWDKE